MVTLQSCKSHKICSVEDEDRLNNFCIALQIVLSTVNRKFITQTAPSPIPDCITTSFFSRKKNTTQKLYY